jgi:hypothetical protein
MAKGKYDKEDYAIKFFVTRRGFEAERDLYWSGSGAPDSVLATFLPRVRCSAASSHMCDV